MLLAKQLIVLLSITYFKATHSNSEMRDIAARICRDYLTGAWKTISAEEIQLRRISGGLSNFLYYVSLPEGKMEGSPPRPTMNCSKRPRRDSYHNILEPKEVGIIELANFPKCCIIILPFYVLRSCCVSMGKLMVSMH